MGRQFVLFEGNGPNGGSQLWETDGTAAGTFQLAVNNANFGGLFGTTVPADFTQYGNMVLFNGTDAAGQVGLWRTDGTAAGTYEITVNGASSQGVRFGADSSPYGVQYAVVGNTVWFQGVDAAGLYGLWQTQGTTATTREVTVPGAYANGLIPGGFIPFANGTKALFEGYAGSLGFPQLYLIANGAVSAVNRLAPGLSTSVNAENGAALGNEVVFNARTSVDSTGIEHSGFWTSDGTVAGTQPFVTDNIYAYNMTAVGNEILFSGLDTAPGTAGTYDLWTTAGTAGSTHSIAAAGASAGGVVPVGLTPDFTRLSGSQILFAGVDAAGNIGLWTTDGTSSATEITVAGAYSGGLFAGTAALPIEPKFTVINGRMLFYGLDASGQSALWSTDGTSAGTTELAVAGGPAGLLPGDLTAITLCFAEGTRIATPDGETPVEGLCPGDAVLTLGGARTVARAVRWVGRFAVDLARHPAPDRAAPVRIRAHAFAEGVPHRDVLLSPDHAVLFQGALFHARALLNGHSVVQEFPRRITYVHVELDRHAVLLAEGLPAESYLDLGTRGCFDGEPGTRPLFPDLAAATWDARACAKLVLEGPRLEAARAHLAGRIERGRLSAGRTAARSRRASA